MDVRVVQSSRGVGDTDLANAQTSVDEPGRAVIPGDRFLGDPLDGSNVFWCKGT